MSWRRFLNSLFEHGRVSVNAPGPLTADERAGAALVLQERELQQRAQLAGIPPEFDLAAALWAAERFYQSCQFAVYREIGGEELTTALALPCPAGCSAAAHYSVDIVFQFLPDLYRLTRQAAQDDPLVKVIGQFAAAWPLSSVGIPELAITNIDAVLEQPTLRQLYVDRIIARQDRARLDDTRVRSAVQAALGCHVELAPEISAALTP